MKRGGDDQECEAVANVGRLLSDDAPPGVPQYPSLPARKVCQQLRTRYPDLTLIVCIWGFAGDTEKAKARFERAQPEQLVTSLSQTVELIQNLDRAPRPEDAEICNA